MMWVLSVTVKEKQHDEWWYSLLPKPPPSRESESLPPLSRFFDIHDFGIQRKMKMTTVQAFPFEST